MIGILILLTLTTIDMMRKSQNSRAGLEKILNNTTLLIGNQCREYNMGKLTESQIKDLKRHLNRSITIGHGICKSISDVHCKGIINDEEYFNLKDILKDNFENGKSYYWKLNLLGNIKRRIALNKIIEIHNKGN